MNSRIKKLLDVCLIAVMLLVLAPIIAIAGTIDQNGVGIPINNVNVIGFTIMAIIGLGVTNAMIGKGGGHHRIGVNPVPIAVWALVGIGSLVAIINPAPVNANAIDNSIGVNCLVIAYDVEPVVNPTIINTIDNNAVGQVINDDTIGALAGNFNVPTIALIMNHRNGSVVAINTFRRLHDDEGAISNPIEDGVRTVCGIKYGGPVVDAIIQRGLICWNNIPTVDSVNVANIGMNILRCVAAINPIPTIDNPVAIIGPDVPKIANVAPIVQNPIAI